MSMFSQANFHCDSASAIFRCDQYEAAKATCASVTPGSFRTTYPSITRLQQHIAQKHFRSLSLSLSLFSLLLQLLAVLPSCKLCNITDMTSTYLLRLGLRTSPTIQISGTIWGLEQKWH